MKYLIANWKANLNLEQVNQFCQKWSTLSVNQEDKEVIVATPSIFYLTAREKQLGFTVALQDISKFNGGAFTGEITVDNLNEITPRYTIIGHSERRREFGETNITVLAKAHQLWTAGITPIICFDLDEMEDLAAKLEQHTKQPMIMAYEPVTAISTSGQAGNLPAAELEQLIPRISANFPGKPIVYGGSVKPSNAADYGSVCDGLLVGSASLEAESFATIVSNF